MQKIALIHTVPTVYATFANRITQRISNVKITNSVDEFLASDAEEQGRMTPVNKSRLFTLLKNAEATGSDVIVVTCSTLSPIVDELRDYVDVPILTIDETMLAEAVNLGNRIAVVATANSTIGPTTHHLQKIADKSGKRIEMSQTVCSQAYVAIKKCDQETHDRLLLKEFERLGDCDVIVLAQASMAHLEQKATEITGKPAVSSPDRCIAKLSSILSQL